MKRFLFGCGFVVLFSCGARTESLTDQDGASGLWDYAGAPTAAGAPSVGGAPNISGAPNVAGSVNIAGSMSATAGAPTVTAGAPTVTAGAPTVTGGAINVAGAINAAGSGATPGIIQVCEALAGSSCRQCLCSSCSSQIVSCFSNLDCVSILACVQQTACQGIACYSAQTCRPVIDQYGGLNGKAMTGVLSLLTCSLGSQNNCSCN